ncbi:EamA-like transporter family [Geosmithia morbida]|uniref:EamA-like transporter family n=1 Tax=Geosmithia morbida TaxID=1094350 RepID=A0A9P4Z0F4_9HYPO|nr:EamA-like transporter family [Geosmithia morbida]KAF4126411.1 EamA-like transporter family [Geosmithia morbida]
MSSQNDPPVPLLRRTSSGTDDDPYSTSSSGPTPVVDQAQHGALPHNIDTQDDVNTRQWIKDPSRTRMLSTSPVLRSLTPSPYSENRVALPPLPPQSALQRFWQRNKSAVLVAVSQFFGASMNLSARLLELQGDGMHPIQVLLLRQSITSLFCTAYMRWKGDGGPLMGSKDIRWLLIIRGVSGFFGIFGMWYSMMYLPLADATVITFLAPGVAGILCYFFLREPFTGIERLATFIALLGVVFIAQPASFFSNPEADEPTGEAPDGDSAIPGFGDDDIATTEERLMAIGVALLGVLGAAGAFTTLRILGKRAHPLVSVNIFGIACTIISVASLILAPLLDIGQPSLRWTWPGSVNEWLLLLSLGVMGFIMQYLLTAGLQGDRSNRANSMVYTHMLFAVSFDRWVFHHEMNLMSLAGCVLILGSAVVVVFLKKPARAQPKTEDVEGQRIHADNDDNDAGDNTESSPMLTSAGGNGENLSFQRL